MQLFFTNAHGDIMLHTMEHTYKLYEMCEIIKNLYCLSPSQKLVLSSDDRKLITDADISSLQTNSIVHFVITQEPDLDCWKEGYDKSSTYSAKIINPNTGLTLKTHVVYPYILMGFVENKKYKVAIYNSKMQFIRELFLLSSVSNQKIRLVVSATRLSLIVSPEEDIDDNYDDTDDIPESKVASMYVYDINSYDVDDWQKIDHYDLDDMVIDDSFSQDSIDDLYITHNNVWIVFSGKSAREHTNKKLSVYETDTGKEHFSLCDKNEVLRSVASESKLIVLRNNDGFYFEIYDIETKNVIVAIENPQLCEWNPREPTCMRFNQNIFSCIYHNRMYSAIIKYDSEGVARAEPLVSSVEYLFSTFADPLYVFTNGSASDYLITRKRSAFISTNNDNNNNSGVTLWNMTDRRFIRTFPFVKRDGQISFSACDHFVTYESPDGVICSEWIEQTAAV